jgi:hypothetical protein
MDMFSSLHREGPKVQVVVSKNLMEYNLKIKKEPCCITCKTLHFLLKAARLIWVDTPISQVPQCGGHDNK